MNKFIKNIPFLNRIVSWAKVQSLPGFKQVPIYDVLVFTIREMMDDDISIRANSMSFSFFVALFPGIIFLFTLLPLLPETAQYALDIRQYIHGFLPQETENYLLNIINDIVGHTRGGLLSFGLLFAIIFSSNGMLTMIYSFEKTQPSFKTRSWIRKRLLAIALTMLVVLIFFTSSLFIVSGNALIGIALQYFDLNESTKFIFQLIRWFSVAFLIYFSIAVIYRYGPSLRKRSSFFSIGTNLATIFIIITSLMFSYFVGNFGRYNELYGSIGALIAFLVWINLICFIILIGFELNASIQVNRDILNEKKGDEE